MISGVKCVSTCETAKNDCPSFVSEFVSCQNWEEWFHLGTCLCATVFYAIYFHSDFSFKGKNKTEDSPLQGFSFCCLVWQNIFCGETFFCLLYKIVESSLPLLVWFCFVCKTRGKCLCLERWKSRKMLTKNTGESFSLGNHFHFLQYHGKWFALAYSLPYHYKGLFVNRFLWDLTF